MDAYGRCRHCSKTNSRFTKKHGSQRNHHQPQTGQMSWLLLTFLSVMSRAVYGVLSKVLSDSVKVTAHTQAVLLSVSAGLIAIIVSPLLGGLHFNLSSASPITVLLVMLGLGLGNIAYFSGIKSLTNGTTQIAFSSILI